MKNVDPKVPSEFQEGRATIDQVESWSRALVQEEFLFERHDIDCDADDELFADIAFARGTTGNRWYLVFDATESGYRYLGTASRVLRTYSYEGECFVVQHGNAGGGEVVMALYAVGLRLRQIGRVTLLLGDGGSEHDQLRYESLKSGELTREELVRMFE